MMISPVLVVILLVSAKDILNYNTPYLIGQHIDIDVDRVSFDAVEGNVDLLPIQKYFFNQVGRDDFSQEFILKSKVKLDLNTLQNVFDELSNVI